MRTLAAAVVALALATRHCAANVALLPENTTLRSQLAGFGPMLDPPGLEGRLLPIDVANAHWAATGCPPLAPPPTLPFNGSWVALVQRGTCSFTEKVRAVQSLGAVAVVVGDNIERDVLVTMYGAGDLSDVTIPSVFVSLASYEALRIAAGSHGKDIVLTHEPHDAPLLDLILTTMLTPVLVMLLIWAFWRMFHRQRGAAEVVPAEAVGSIPTKTFDLAAAAENDPRTCAICLDDFGTGDQLRRLACRHEFHIACVDPWLRQRSKLCPICKALAVPGAAAAESVPLLADPEPLAEILSDDSASPEPVGSVPLSPACDGWRRPAARLGTPSNSSESSRSSSPAAGAFPVSPPRQAPKVLGDSTEIP